MNNNLSLLLILKDFVGGDWGLYEKNIIILLYFYKII